MIRGDWTKKILKLGSGRGFSLLEMLVSVMIIIILSVGMFQFLLFNQEHFRRQQIAAETSFGARAGLEVMIQELGQAGGNPAFDANKTLGNGHTATGNLVKVRIAGGTTPKTKGIFYGTRLVIGTDGSTEEVVVKGDAGGNLIDIDDVPVILSNDHNTGDPVFTRNYPYGSGILYTQTAAAMDQVETTNTVQYFGDIKDTGDLWYGEYNIVCQASGNNACAASCTDDLYQINRFTTVLTDSDGVFSIPASKAASGDTASPLVQNIVGTCDGNDILISPSGAPVFELTMNTYGAFNNVSSTAFYQTFVMVVMIDLTVQSDRPDPDTNALTTQSLRSMVVPRNVLKSHEMLDAGVGYLIPPTPTDMAFSPSRTLPLP